LISIHRHMLHSDLLLPSASVLIEPFGQEGYCPRGLVSKLRISYLHRSILRQR
jgi:hypothetical protein